MRLTILLAALLPGLAPLPASERPATAPTADLRTGGFGKPDCPFRPDVLPVDQRSRPNAKRLGDLPPGDLRLAVLREVDGCPEPVIVRQGFGPAAPDLRAQR